MKRLFVGYLFLIAATVAAYLAARAGHLALALLPLMSYAATLIWLLYKNQIDRDLFDAVVYHRVKDLIKDNQRLAEALIVVAEETQGVSAFLETRGGEVYAIDLPNQDRIILYRPTAKEEERKG